MLLFSAPIFGQTTYKELRGQVISDSLEVEDIYVINQTSQESTITNQNGYFQIEVKLNDTLLFSAVQYKIKSIIIAPEIYIQDEILVKLEEKVNELPDVVVRPYNLSGNLAEDSRNINTDDVVNGVKLGLPNASVRMPTQSERKLYTATASPLTSLDPLINAITGRTKMLKNQVKLEKKENELNETMSSFEKSFYLNHLKIPEENIVGFLYFCAASPEFDPIQSNLLLVLEFFEKKAGEYLKTIASEK